MKNIYDNGDQLIGVCKEIKKYNDKLYKNYIDIFNNLTGCDDIDYCYCVRIYRDLTDYLLKNRIIKEYGIKNYMIIKTGEII